MKASLILLTSFICSIGFAQIDLEQKLKDKLKERAERRTDEAIDKALDKTEEEAKKAAKGKKKDKQKEESENSNAPKDSQNQGSSGVNTGNSQMSEEAKDRALKTYSKFDFIPGEKIISEEQFSDEAVGDFPIDWNTNSGGEVVSVEGREGKWLMLKNPGVFMPEAISSLPENFTLEFDLLCNEEFSFYSSAFALWFSSMKNPDSEFISYGRFDRKAHALRIELHPSDAGGQKGKFEFTNYDKDAKELIRNSIPITKFNVPDKSAVHVSVWRQKNRVRVYLDDEKIIDLPRAFESTANYNRIVFMRWEGQDNDRYLIGNMRFAIGAPDTRSKLITEGKLVTRGILFDSGSEKIKPESYGTLKDIAQTLSENPDVRVRIIGHTDSDGEESMNLELSKKRASAVKAALVNEFGLSEQRMETDGRGEAEPSEKNDSSAGKANNRRVEFIKL